MVYHYLRKLFANPIQFAKSIYLQFPPLAVSQNAPHYASNALRFATAQNVKVPDCNRA